MTRVLAFFPGSRVHLEFGDTDDLDPPVGYIRVQMDDPTLTVGNGTCFQRSELITAGSAPIGQRVMIDWTTRGDPDLHKACGTVIPLTDFRDGTAIPLGDGLIPVRLDEKWCNNTDYFFQPENVFPIPTETSKENPVNEESNVEFKAGDKIAVRPTDNNAHLKQYVGQTFTVSRVDIDHLTDKQLVYVDTPRLNGFFSDRFLLVESASEEKVPLFDRVRDHLFSHERSISAVSMAEAMASLVGYGLSPHGEDEVNVKAVQDYLAANPQLFCEKGIHRFREAVDLPVKRVDLTFTVVIGVEENEADAVTTDLLVESIVDGLNGFTHIEAAAVEAQS